MPKKYEDISSTTTPSGFKEKMEHFWGKIKTFFLRNRKRNLKAFLSIVICLVLVVAAMGGAYLRKMLTLINYNEGTIGDPDATFATEEEEEENLNYASMSDVADPDSIKDLMKSWATNGGEKLHSKNVINVLLIGEDNDDGSHRSDTMMLASVNRKTKTITLTSFMRDSYTYMEINGQDRYDKTNHAYCWAGASKVMEVLSNNYKVQIDHYVSIDFQSFKDVIDLLGGVTVSITEKEASYMNRTTHFNDFQAGDNVKLDGEHALIYARIRKLDDEVERTRRQRNVIASVVHNAKASSVSDINKAVETFLPYITTNYKSSEIVSLGTQALSEGWLQYDIVGMVEPSENLREGVNGFTTYTGNLFVWIVDYVRAAQEVQNALYGTTNIEIGSDHVSAIDMLHGNYSSSGDSSGNNSGGSYTTGYYDAVTDTTVADETTDFYSGNDSYYEDTTTSTTRWAPFNWTTGTESDDTTSSTSIRDLLTRGSTTAATTAPPETSEATTGENSYAESTTAYNQENGY